MLIRRSFARPLPAASPGVAIILFGLMLGSGPASRAQDGDPLKHITFGGVERSFRIHLPSGSLPSAPTPLVIALHGGGGTAANMIGLTLGGFDRLADSEQFIVVYPEGIDKQWNDGRTGSGHRTERENTDDVGFIGALIDTLIATTYADPRRVYVTGMSNGAIMSYRLACELSRKIAAVAPVDGAIAEQTAHRCAPVKPVSVLAINNVDDRLVHWDGGDVTGPFGKRKLGRVLSVRTSVALWVEHDHCSPAPVVSSLPDVDPADGTRVRTEAFSGGEEGTEVVLYAVEGGGHTWPGGKPYLPEWLIGKTCRDLDACRAIWEFFKQHERR
jgi:polyhydroxybutyrate depolymerase